MGKNHSLYQALGRQRRKSKAVRIGKLYIGAHHPIAVQSMTKVETKNTAATLRQIRDLERVGCQIIRLTIEDQQDAQGIKKIKRFTNLPLVADIHFDWRLAIAAIENGIDKIRLNPGNIYRKDEIENITRAAKSAGIPIRVGLNSGSLKRIKKQKAKSKNLAVLMVSAALDYIKILEKCGLGDIVISLKGSDIFDTVEAYSLMARHCDYPFHLGLTATGGLREGIIKSSIALGILLSGGLGDTIRVSLTAEPREEVLTARSILATLNLNRCGVNIVSCPTCGRCKVDLIRIVRELETRLSGFQSRYLARPLNLAVMGCVVNGPGEASQADLGVAFGRTEGLLFKKGKPVKKVDFKNSVEVLLKETENF